MKYIGIILAAILGTFIDLKYCNKPAAITDNTSEIKGLKDSIAGLKKRAAQVKISYIPKYIEVANSHRPDTFIQRFTDTIRGNKDSFIYVTILQGKECCEILPFKDSILNLDSIMMVKSEANLAKLTKKNKELKVWQRVLIGLSFVIGGALVVK